MLIKIAGGKQRRLRGHSKGMAYRAILKSNGLIEYDGTQYKSPSGAAIAACGRPTNGWSFWCYKVKNGEWVPLSSARPKSAVRKVRRRKSGSD